VNNLHILSATLFSPRGGSAYVARALARGLRDEGVGVTLVAGSHAAGEPGDAAAFYAGLDVHAVRYGDRVPMHPSFEDRPGAEDQVFAAVDDVAYRRQVDAWAAELQAAGAGRADVLHLHHLTPLNAAAAIAAPGTPVVGQLHGTELLMLEAIDAGAPWPHAAAWAARLRTWAAAAARLVVAPGNLRRAADLLGLPRERFVALPNGFDPAVFRPRAVDRRAVWGRVLGDVPRDPVLLYVGRFTAVKRVPLLLEAFALARPRMAAPASLVIVGGYPGESEGEHPAAAVARLGLDGVRLAGWFEQHELPELLAASDLLVLSSARESFGQVVVEAMACGVPPIATASPGPAHIVADGETGWLVPVDDRAALADAMVDAVARPDERARRGRAALEVARERYAWPAIARRFAAVLREVAPPRARGSAARTHARSG
jgi:glycosyltransferase involved in cell wall biosynthesis